MSDDGAQGLGRRTGYTPNLVRGMGARLDSITHLKRREQLLDMALGVFTSAGVTHLQLPEHGALTCVSDLLLHSLDELEAIAEEKGGVCALLDEKWRKVYKTNASLGLFTKVEMRAA